MQNLDIASVLSLINGLLFEVSTKNKSVNYAYYDDDYLCKDISFNDFSSLVCKKLGLNEKSFSCEEILDWILEKKGENFLVFSVNSLNDEKNKIKISRITITPGKLLCYLENLEDKKNLYDLKDSLTNVYQKAAFTRMVKNQILKNPEVPFYMLIIDIDNFKEVNDTHGHLFGDTILSSVAGILDKSFKNGKVGRIGGDEFAVISFESLEYDDIWNKLYKLCHDVNDISKTYDRDVTISITIGCSKFPFDSSNYDELFMKADRALYRGKRKGKNCFIVYDDEKHKNISVDVLKRYDERVNQDGINSTSFIISLLDNLMKPDGYEENIKSMLSLLGKYFFVNRVVFSVKDSPKTETVKFVWDKDGETTNVDVKMNIDYWDEHIQEGICKMSKVSNIKKINPSLYNMLNKQNVFSVVRLKVGYDDEIASIRLDSYTERSWQLEETDLFKIILRIFSVYLYKMNENILLEEQIYTDHLTGLNNYSSFLNKATSTLTDCKSKMTLYYFNLEKFRYINENFSFKVGDSCLLKISRALEEVFSGKYSLLCRPSGTKFIVLDEYKSDLDIKVKFNTFISIVNSIVIDGVMMKDYLNFHVGIYITNGIENEATSIIDKAKLASRFILDNNKSGYLIFYESMVNKYNFQDELEANFKESLRREEFKVYLQPKININSGKIVGAEALSRWNYRGVKLLSPDDYIPILEKSGMITELDYYVFSKVCEYIVRLKENGIKPVPISVNLSRAHANFDDYLRRVVNIIKEYNVSPEYIEIEITESMFVSNMESITSLIEKLHNAGFKVSMDDFGSGYSNLLLLAHANFDILKIDKSLCGNTKDKKLMIIVSSIIRLAKELDLNIICEGVETKEQALSLSSMGCENAQGYLYDRPLSINDFTNKYLKN